MTPTDSVSQVRVGVDVMAASTLFAAIVDWLPKVLGVLGGVLSILWFMVQLWESRTIQEAMESWKARRKLRRLARLQAKAKILAAKIAAVETVRFAKVVATELVEQAKTTAAIKLAVTEKDDGVGV